MYARNIMDKNHPHSEIFYAGGFLYNPETKHILLHQRDGNTAINPNKWAFFGGTSEYGESAIDCCLREWKEELGIDNISAKNLIALRDYLNIEQGTWRYVFYTESTLKKESMILGEGADFAWIPIEKVFEYDLTDKTQEDLRYFLETIRP